MNKREELIRILTDTVTVLSDKDLHEVEFFADWLKHRPKVKNLSVEQQITLLQNEINWCLDHPDDTLNKDQQMGFVNGLRQAQTLIEAAEQSFAVDWAKRGSEYTAFAKFEDGKVVSVRKKRPTTKA